MSAEDLSSVHRRYIRVSNTFKAAWTFHQFIQGVHKIFPKLEAAQYPADFQSIYGELKQVPQHLSDSGAETAAAQLASIKALLAPLIESLLAVDLEISPGRMRQFFQRVKNYDDNILNQLVKFYLYTRDEGGWQSDRLDKLDYLCTKLGEEYHDSQDAFRLRDPTQLREQAQSFWAALALGDPSESHLAETREEIRAMGKRMSEISSIDEIHQSGVVPKYRDTKHRLGDLFFHPRLLPTLIEANLCLKNQIHRLYRLEEQRIVAEYQQVFELERDVPIDVKLGEELSDFRQAVERFEEQLQGENLRLKELADLREKVRVLVPKLQPEGEPEVTESSPMPREAREYLTEHQEREAPSGIGVMLKDEYVRKYYDAIVASLDNTNPTLDARKIVLQPEVFALGLGPREITAYRRLFSGDDCDRGLEDFLLCSAALRSRIENEVEEIKGILDESSVTQDGPVFARARRTVRRADRYYRHFEHLVSQAVLSADSREARAIQVLKMRMMRAYSGLWLMVHRT